MTLGHRLKKFRKEKDLTLQQVADVFGITRSAVGSWERDDTRPDQSKLSGLARLYGTTVEHLLTGSGNRDTVSTPLKNQSTGLPLIPIEQAGKWSRSMNANELVTERVPCPFPHSADAFITRVPGQSMFDPSGEKSYREGEYIAVDPAKTPHHRSTVLVALGNGQAAAVRQLLIESDGVRMLQALNPAWPNRIAPLSPDDVIIGVVIGKWVPE